MNKSQIKQPNDKDIPVILFFFRENFQSYITLWIPILIADKNYLSKIERYAFLSSFLLQPATLVGNAIE